MDSPIVYIRPDERAAGFELCILRGNDLTVTALSRSSLLRIMTESSNALAKVLREDDKRKFCTCPDRT
jgi:hypothetical protein